MSKYVFLAEGPSGDQLGGEGWVFVGGGGLDAPIYIRLARTRDGGAAIVGLFMGGSASRPEITANALRQVKPREILSSIMRGFDPDNPPAADASGMEWATWDAMLQLHIGSHRWPQVTSDPSSARGASTGGRLEEFARVYMKERDINPHRAMTATAEVMHISRATANRWAARARKQGLIPTPSPE